MNPFKRIASLTVVALAAGSVHAAQVSGPWDIASVEMRQVQEVVQPTDVQFDNDCNHAFQPFMLEEISWDQIVNIGQKLWTVVEANKPVVNIGTVPMANALPRGLACWADLDSWQAPKVNSYDVTYKNGFGMEVVKFRFRLQYTYGGGHEGKGKYLANVTVMPAEVNVMWGYTFSADVDVQQAVNLGSFESPVAGLELNLKWQVKTVLKQSDNSFHFFVQGDGVSQAQN